MLGIKISVHGNEAKVTEKPRYLTAGMVGLPVEFTLDEQWDGLDKLAVFQAGHQIMTKEASGTVVTVPWEVMKRPNVWLSIGIYGIAQDGSVAIPTIWANVAVIYPGANPNGDPALAPDLPIWKELKNDNEAIHKKLDELNELKGEKGDTPVKGVDYFTEEDIKSLEESFIPVGEQDFGYNNSVGAKGYYIYAFGADANGNPTIALSMRQGVDDTEGLDVKWEAGHVLSMKCNNAWYHDFGKIVAVNGNVISVDSLPTDPKTGKTVVLGEHAGFDDNSVISVTDPVAGQVELCKYVASFGYSNAVHTKGGFSAGGGNYIGPSAGNAATIGFKLINRGSNAVVINYNNVNDADNSFVGGMTNVVQRIKSGTNIVFGYLLKLLGQFCAMFGYENSVVCDDPKSPPSGTMVFGRWLFARGSGQLVCGQANEDDGTDKYKNGKDQNSRFVVGGGLPGSRKTVFRVRSNGNTDVCDNKVENLATGTAATDAANVGQMYAAINEAVDAITPEAIGAASNSHTHTPKSIGAASSGHTHDSRYYTQDQVDEKFEQAQLGGGEVDLSGYVTEDELNAKGYLTEHQSLEGLATETFVTDKIAEAHRGSGESGDVDVSGFVTDDELSTAVEEALAQAKASGEFDGADGQSVTHEWDDTVLYVTSASGTSGRDLQGAQGIQGEPGVSIVTAEIVDGELELAFSDGSSKNVGRVVGEDGKDGTGGITREFNSGEISTSSYTYTGGDLAKIYNVYVIYTVGAEQLDDVFTIDWTVLTEGNSYYNFARHADADSRYSLGASKDSGGHPIFESSNCTIARVIGYY